MTEAAASRFALPADGGHGLSEIYERYPPVAAGVYALR
jgi:hypothetical protein